MPSNSPAFLNQMQHPLLLKFINLEANKFMVIETLSHKIGSLVNRMNGLSEYVNFKA